MSDARAEPDERRTEVASARVADKARQGRGLLPELERNILNGLQCVRDITAMIGVASQYQFKSNPDRRWT